MAAFGGMLATADTAENSISALDIAELARQFTAVSQGSSDEKVVALVSLGMPPESLRRLAKYSKAAGIPLVLRGLKDNSVNQTIKALLELKAHPLTTWQVDPRIFRALKVNAAPAIAVVSGKEHLIVRGDVPLEYSLSLLAKEKSPLAAIAARSLAQLRRETAAIQ